MPKRSIFFNSILGTLFIASFIVLFEFVTLFGNFDLLDPIADAIGDVEMTDIVFSSIRQTPPVDANIVLVNIGELSRREIARQVQIINKYQPAAVGIDSYFWTLKEDSVGDLMLRNALANVSNLVMVSKLEYNPITDEYDSIRFSHPYFNPGHTGYANLETDAIWQYQYKVCRNFPPKQYIARNLEVAFGVKVAELVDRNAAQEFLARGNDAEVINYRGNVIDFGQTRAGGRFIALDVDDVLHERFQPELLEGKTVLMGFMGRSFNDRSWEDRFYTPLNVNYAGRSNPDMFGVVIHANIVSMILNRDYLGKQSEFSGIVTAGVICFLTVLLFTVIYHRLPKWYDGITKSLQFIMVVMLLTINVLVFHWFNYKLSLTLTTIVVLLSGDALEVCYGLLMNLFSKTGRNLIFKLQ